jgi:cell division protein FtsW
MNWRHFIPFFDTTAMDWAVTPRLLRWLTFVWLFVGLAVMYSASFPVGDAIGDGLYYFKRQLIAIALGMILFNLLIHAPLRYIQGTASFAFIALRYFHARLESIRQHTPNLKSSNFHRS